MTYLTEWYILTTHIVYLSCGISVKVIVQESQIKVSNHEKFEVKKAIFYHPNGTMTRTDKRSSGTGQRESIEQLLNEPMNWFEHIEFPKNYEDFVSWIEEFPD